MSDHLNSTELIILAAVRDGRVSATRDGYAIDGRPVGEQTRDLIGILLLDEYVDVDLVALDTPQMLTLTTWGEQALARHEQESRR